MPIRGLHPEYVERAQALCPLIRAHADESEAARRLPPVVAMALAEAGLYRVAAPRELQGADADPVTQIEVIEAVSRADGSTGWNLMIGIEAFGLVAPHLGEATEWVKDPAVVLSAATSAMGRAERSEGGYRVTGQWQFVSGIHNARLFAGTVMRYEGGELVPGPPAYAVARDDEYEILDTWHVSGMRGSGSHDLRLADVWLPEERVVVPAAAAATDRSPLRGVPLSVRLAYNKVGVSLGIARAALDEFVELATGKTPRFSSDRLRERAIAQRAIAESELRVRSARALVFEMAEELWAMSLAKERIGATWRALFQIACSDAARGCVEAVDGVAEAAGTTPNRLDHRLERLVRDVRVVRQHAMVAPQHIEDGGRVLLGLPPEGMMLDPRFFERRPDRPELAQRRAAPETTR